MFSLELGCECGAFAASVQLASNKDFNRLVCYCEDCQAFAGQLRSKPKILNAHGGTDILQVPPCHLRLQQGVDQLACLQLKPGGLYRWYTHCCETAIANTVGPALPLVGLIHSCIRNKDALETLTGSTNQAAFIKQASPALPKGYDTGRPQFLVITSMLSKLLRWKLQGKAKPNPLFTTDRKPIAKASLVKSTI